MKWEEGDPPATDILKARFRAKYYGAKVITYRPFLERVLEHNAARRSKERAARDSIQESPHLGNHYSGEQYKTVIADVPTIDPDKGNSEDALDPKTIQHARNGITALIKSTTAFHGLGDPGEQRLIVTNAWGTAHAYVPHPQYPSVLRFVQYLTDYRQWGNVITLLAASVDPVLGKYINKDELKDLYHKTMGFLKLVGQPSSALTIDRKILEHVAQETELIAKPSASFSSNSGDVPMGRH